MNGKRVGNSRKTPYCRIWRWKSIHFQRLFCATPRFEWGSGELMAMRRIAKSFSIEQLPENRKKGHFILASKRFICYNKPLV